MSVLIHRIQEYTDARHDPMIPHTVVLEPGLKVFKIYTGDCFWGRPREARERESFYPYGRPWGDVFARMAGAVDQFDRGGDR